MICRLGAWKHAPFCDMEELEMECKTFECPYLTEADKEFLEYEQKVYEESAKEIIALYRKYKDRRKSDFDSPEDYSEYSYLSFAVETNIFNACSNIQSIFIRDICCYFCQTRGIKELNVFVPQYEIADKTKILTLDEVFDEYIRKYLEGKQDEQ